MNIGPSACQAKAHDLLSVQYLQLAIKYFNNISWTSFMHVSFLSGMVALNCHDSGHSAVARGCHSAVTRRPLHSGVNTPWVARRRLGQYLQAGVLGEVYEVYWLPGVSPPFGQVAIDSLHNVVCRSRRPRGGRFLSAGLSSMHHCSDGMTPRPPSLPLFEWHHSSLSCAESSWRGVLNL